MKVSPCAGKPAEPAMLIGLIEIRGRCGEFQRGVAVSLTPALATDDKRLHS